MIGEILKQIEGASFKIGGAKHPSMCACVYCIHTYIFDIPIIGQTSRYYQLILMVI